MTVGTKKHRRPTVVPAKVLPICFQRRRKHVNTCSDRIWQDECYDADGEFTHNGHKYSVDATRK
ncbi:hypothetical protein Z517_09383, partial [Fonsecaea pedrosoi CBS 271.37]